MRACGRVHVGHCVDEAAEEGSRWTERPRWGWWVLVALVNIASAGTLGLPLLAYLFLVKRWHVVEYSGQSD